MTTTIDLNTVHICGEHGCGIGGMREFYDRLGLIPTSERADIVLIRSHLAYWAGNRLAADAEITASRGHNYKVMTRRGRIRTIVRITDHYDHREGVVGWK